MTLRTGWRTAALGTVFAALALAASVAQETPKRGGTLTYMIPADGPPSFDGHREATYATVHSAAPYYSVLIRVDPNNPGSATDFVCDLCTEMPQRPTTARPTPSRSATVSNSTMARR
jgi:peptide/nickel transport system substrate-binding protein